MKLKINKCGLRFQTEQTKKSYHKYALCPIHFFNKNFTIHKHFMNLTETQS